MIVRDLLADATRRLAGVGVPGAARDARLLLAAALRLDPQRLVLASGDVADAAAARRFASMVEQRIARRPVSQILDLRRFWGRDFHVTADVLDPRPETECLVALALEGAAPGRILDLGTGSGVLLVTLLAEWPGARGRGTDISPAALAVARRNAGRHGVAARAAFAEADWLDGEAGVYDLIVCNPPYIAASEVAGLSPEVRLWEPRQALSPGPGGLESYRRIAPRLARHLAPRGRALLEFGAGQGSDVAEIFRGAGLADARLHPDLDGRDRIVSLSRLP